MVRNAFTHPGGGTRKRRIYFYRGSSREENETVYGRGGRSMDRHRKDDTLPSKCKLQFDESTNGFTALLYLRPNTGVARTRTI